jgi:hypothetical protein
VELEKLAIVRETEMSERKAVRIQKEHEMRRRVIAMEIEEFEMARCKALMEQEIRRQKVLNCCQRKDDRSFHNSMIEKFLQVDWKIEGFKGRQASHSWRTFHLTRNKLRTPSTSRNLKWADMDSSSWVL